MTLTLACKNTGKVYTIRSLRHQYHEYSKPAQVLEDEDQQKADRAKALEIMRREKEEQERADRQRALEIVAENMKVCLFLRDCALAACSPDRQVRMSRNRKSARRWNSRKTKGGNGKERMLRRW